MALADVRDIEVQRYDTGGTLVAFVLVPVALFALLMVVVCSGDSDDGGIGSPC